MIPFSAAELSDYNRNRGFLARVADVLPWSARRRLLRERQGRMVNVWTNDDPDWNKRGGDTFSCVSTYESIIADGTQISNSTTETITTPDFNIPAYYMFPGRTLRIWNFGVMSNVVTTPGTLTMRLRWGGVAGTILLASAAQGLDTTARTNSLWASLMYVTCRTAGSSGTFMSSGIMWGNVLSSTAANLLPALLGSAGAPLASGNAAVTVDTTAVKALSTTATFSVATSPTNLTCQSRVIEVLN